MISNNKARSVIVASVAFSSVMLLSGCSWLKIDSITDTVNYRGNSGSIASLEVPPGLTTPNYDPTYTIQRPVSAADVPPPTQAAVTANQAPVTVPANGAALSASLSTLKDGNPALAVAGRYDQVWAKTGMALPRMGLSITSQQYDQGIYTVTSGSTVPQQDQGVVSRVMSFFKSFKKEDQASGALYKFIIGDRGEQSLIVVGDASGAPLNANDASSLLARLKAELAQ
jgi:uncharacterized lipoprotein